MHTMSIARAIAFVGLHLAATVILVNAISFGSEPITEGTVIGRIEYSDGTCWLQVKSGSNRSGWIMVTRQTFDAHGLDSYLANSRTVVGVTQR